MDGLSRMKWRDWLTLIFIVPFVAAKKLYQRAQCKRQGHLAPDEKGRCPRCDKYIGGWE